MRIVVSDTSPINYLVQLGCGGLLTELFEQVVVPPSVQDELLSLKTPTAVRDWVLSAPPWMGVGESLVVNLLPGIHQGEMEAIALAMRLNAPLLIDDLRGREYAKSLGIEVIGTVGVLARLGGLGLIDFEDALDRLLRTNFRLSPKSVDRILESYRNTKNE